jgi:uncharacterized membrane protein YebE (DUF533 family)
MSMQPITSPGEAPARVLALMVASNGHIDEREMRMLDELDAYRRLAVPRQRFVELAQACLGEVGTDLAERSWLSLDESLYLVGLLDAVADPGLRLLVCRLAAAVITSDGSVSGSERRIYGFTLARWGITQEQVAQAIRQDSHHHTLSSQVGAKGGAGTARKRPAGASTAD